MSTMKILLPYRDSCDREITSSVVSGGGEQFCKLINKNFYFFRYFYTIGIEIF